MTAARTTARSATFRTRSVRGFTLIEVLVVVAIIALLISILLPSLSAARQQARIVACGSNLRTVGQGMIYYCQASKDEMPAGYNTDADGKVKLTNGVPTLNLNPWEFLHPFVQKVSNKKGQRIDIDASNNYSLKLPTFSCPSDRKQHTTTQRPMMTADGMKKVELQLSYTSNLNVLMSQITKDSKKDLEKPAQKLNSIKRAGTVVAWHDGGDDGSQRYDIAQWVFADCRSEIQEVTWANQCTLEVRHQTGNNFAYVDTHVSFSKFNFSKPDYGLPRFPISWIPNYAAGGDWPTWITNPAQRPAPAHWPAGYTPGT